MTATFGAEAVVAWKQAVTAQGEAYAAQQQAGAAQRELAALKQGKEQLRPMASSSSDSSRLGTT